MWFGVVLHCWVGLSWMPILGPADPILRVETAFQEFILALHLIGSCCFSFGFLIYAGTVVLPVSSSNLRLLHSLPSRTPVDHNEARAQEDKTGVTIDRGAKQIVGAGTATATEPTREHRQYATQGPTTYLCT